MSALHASPLALVLVAACSGDVTEVPVRLGDEESCAPLLRTVDAELCFEAPREMRSVRARPIRFESSREIDTLDVPDECRELEPGTTRAQALLDAFRDGGYFARNIPADEPTMLQIVGFEEKGCPDIVPEETVVPMCGYTLPVVEDAESAPEEGVNACFVCDRPTVGQCIWAPTMDDL